jgi:hypothetical protein
MLSYSFTALFRSTGVNVGAGDQPGGKFGGGGGQCGGVRCWVRDYPILEGSVCLTRLRPNSCGAHWWWSQFEFGVNCECG